MGRLRLIRDALIGPAFTCTRRHPCSERNPILGENPLITHGGRCWSKKLTRDEWFDKYVLRKG